MGGRHGEDDERRSVFVYGYDAEALLTADYWMGKVRPLVERAENAEAGLTDAAMQEKAAKVVKRVHTKEAEMKRLHDRVRYAPVAREQRQAWLKKMESGVLSLEKAAAELEVMAPQLPMFPGMNPNKDEE